MCVFVTVIIRKIFGTNNFGKCIRAISWSHFHALQTSVTTIWLFDNNSQVRYPIRHVRYFIHKQFQMLALFIQKHFVIWPRLACQQTTALLKEFPGFFMLKSLAQVELRDDLITSCGYLWFALTFSTSCGFLRVGF